VTRLVIYSNLFQHLAGSCPSIYLSAPVLFESVGGDSRGYEYPFLIPPGAQSASGVSRSSGMAIYPTTSTYALGSNSNTSPPQPINIEAWTEQATQSLSAVSLVPLGGVRGTSVSLAISLDEKAALKQDHHADGASSAYRTPREPLRRDSLKRREALLKGKEGSRRRTRWENGSYQIQAT